MGLRRWIVGSLGRWRVDVDGMEMDRGAGLIIYRERTIYGTSVIEWYYKDICCSYSMGVCFISALICSWRIFCCYGQSKQPYIAVTHDVDLDQDRLPFNDLCSRCSKIGVTRPRASVLSSWLIY